VRQFLATSNFLSGGSSFLTVSTPSLREGIESAPPTVDPSTQIGEMGTLLESISASSDNLPSTLGSCSTVASDIGPLRQLIQDRTAHLQQAQNLRTDAISDGESLKQALVPMLQATLDADQKYLDWAEQPECTSIGSDSAITEATTTPPRRSIRSSIGGTRHRLSIRPADVRVGRPLADLTSPR
jgi:hypothetical protein